MQREHGLNMNYNSFRQNSLNKERVSFHEAHYLNQNKRPPQASMALRTRNSSAPKFQYTESETLKKDQACVISGSLNKMSFKQNYVQPENLGIRYNFELNMDNDEQPDNYTNLLCKKRIKRSLNHRKRMERFRNQDTEEVKKNTDK